MQRREGKCHRPLRGIATAAAGCVRRLHAAIEEGNEKKAAKLLDSCRNEGADIDAKHKGRTALHLACSKGLCTVTELLIANDADINASDENQATPLSIACQSDDVPIIALLLKHGADVNASGQDGSPLLELAIRRHSNEVASMLAAAGSWPNAVNRRGQTALHVCAEVNESDVIALLLCKDYEIDKEDDSRRTALSIAAGGGFSPILERLIEAGANINHQDVQKKTPLAWAVQRSHLSCAKALLDAGADQRIPDTKRVTPLMHAVLALDLPMIELLVGHRGGGHSSLDLADWQGTTPLLAAIRAATQNVPGSSDIGRKAGLVVSSLISAGCQVDVSDGSTGQTALIMSCLHRCTEMTAMLLAARADVTMTDNKGDTALHAASAVGSIEDVDLLLRTTGCQVNARNTAGQSALFKATKSHVHVKVLQLLIAAGAELDVMDAASQTPLHEAIENGHGDAALLLIDSGCKYNILDGRGRSPLCLACLKGDQRVMAKLTAKADCDVNLGLELPLHVAVRKGNWNMTAALIERKADINVANDEGQTPLLIAVETYDLRIISLLLQHGAAVDSSCAASSTTKPSMRCCSTHDDAHPHVILQPLFECVRFQDMVLFKQLLDRHYRTPYALLRTLHDMVTINHVDGRVLLTEDACSKLLLVLRAAMESVRSLQQLCRGVVLERLGGEPPVKVGSLSLPSKLKSFLLYQDSEECAAHPDSR